MQSGYHNAQLWNYVQRSNLNSPVQLENQPPLRLSLSAYCIGEPGELVGTAGFGFWNHPLSPERRRFPRLPRAAWFFFASKRSNMALDYDVPGSGWKCAVIDAINPRALALIPLALPAALAMQSKTLYAKLYPAVQRALKIDEHPLDLEILREHHHYQIDWLIDRVSFSIDNHTVFETPFSPAGPLGLVIWMDNRLAVVTPQGHFGFGAEAVRREQGMVVEKIVMSDG
ncbi:MAG: hypothetical protein IAE89_05845 [Anaerolineae bacterium]|nr:hypothetical protein [Anaerolineae bacterium]